MKIRVFASMLCLSGIVGCVSIGPITYFFKPGVSIAQKDKDSFDCELEASRTVPVNSQIGTTPTYRTPIQTSCYGYTCTTTGGQVYGGNVYSYDANKSLREEYYGRCLAQKGYQSAMVPVCPTDLKLSDDLKKTLVGKVRAPTEGACAYQVTQRSGNLIYKSERVK